MQITKTNPNDYINSLPDEKREVIKKLDAAISKAIPSASRVMWEGIFWGGSEQKIIGYGDYSYVRPGKKTVEWFIIGLTYQKNYASVFLTAVEDGEYLAEKYKKDLGKVKVGRSSISFKKLSDINLDKLVELIKKGYELMTKQASAGK